jgi:hypothetical protein
MNYKLKQEIIEYIPKTIILNLISIYCILIKTRHCLLKIGLRQFIYHKMKLSDMTIEI